MAHDVGSARRAVPISRAESPTRSLAARRQPIGIHGWCGEGHDQTDFPGESHVYRYCLTALGPPTAARSIACVAGLWKG